MITQQGTVLVTGEQEVTASVDGAPVDPYEGVTLVDPTLGTTVTVTVDLSAAQGTLTDGPGYTGLTHEFIYGTESPFYVDARYTLASGTPSQVSAELDGLVFTPSAYSDASSPSTSLLLTATGQEPDTGLITGSDVQPTTTTTQVEVVPSRSVTLDGAVAYGNGAFTLSGTASAIAGVRSVEISALVDGTRQDLGAATVNPDGTFDFADMAGTSTQSFFVATLIDEAGGRTASADPGFNLTGGLGPVGRYGVEKSFGTTQEVSTAVFRPDGQRFLSQEAPGQTVDLGFNDVVAAHRYGDTTFVFNPGDGVDVIGGFRLRGARHDTLQLPSADFRNVAAVLRNTTDAGGYVTVTDPRTGEGVQLDGLTKAELAAHPKDFAFA